MIKLTKDTRDQLEVGDILVSPDRSISYIVTELENTYGYYQPGLRVYYTIITHTPNDSFDIYGRFNSAAISKLYHFNIIKPDEFTDEDIAIIKDLGLQNLYDCV